ncbi:dienelactone hydrolase [Mesotoga sp. SC_NapDC2]|nr:dienelactone hydrolase [Mesotoga sp. SC_NapDC3]PXF34738.1 dienelactone hydrolase [Mesotoga sp. SC_NapDC]RIZ61799.1 dienelactone hydrolase [Mesotoga sp. SC_NapDC2]
MIKRILVSAVLIASVLSFASIDIAKQYLDSFFNGKFPEAYELQNAEMKKAQPLSAMRNLRGQLQMQVGDFVQILNISEVPQGDLVSYIFASEFKAGIFDVIITLDADKKVAGFFIRPSTYVKPETESIMIETGNEVVDTYLKGFFSGEFENIFELQNEQVKASLTPEALSGAYANIVGVAGEFVEVLNLESSTNDGMISFVLTCRFANGIFDITVTLDSDEKVAGFYFRQSAYSERELPEYADPSAYTEQDITVGKEPYYLPAKLMVPNDLETYPLVIILQGSGTHDIDGTLGPNKPYRDIAVGLASKGIATLRYPKKYLVYPDKVDEIGTSAEAEYVDDALVVIEQMKSIPLFSGIYLAGHSMGGMVAPWIAEEAGVDGVIVLAGSPVKLAQISLDQNLDLAGDQMTEEQKAQTIEFFNQLLNGEIPEETELAPGLTAGYYYSLDRYFCMPVLEETELPVLIANAELDFQSPKHYFDVFVEELKDRPNITLKLFEGLNHLFMETDGKMKSIEEYSRPGYVSVELIDLIVEWVNELALD